jgi:hypothetical protein
MKSNPPRHHRGRPARESRDNRANQLNRNNDAFWQSRGYPERPVDWRTSPSSRRSRPPKKSR